MKSPRFAFDPFLPLQLELALMEVPFNPDTFLPLPFSP